MFTLVVDVLIFFAIAVAVVGALTRYRANLNTAFGLASTIGFGLALYFWWNLYLEVQRAGGVLVLKALPVLASSSLRISSSVKIGTSDSSSTRGASPGSKGQGWPTALKKVLRM